MENYSLLPGGFFYKVARNQSEINIFNFLLSTSYADIFIHSNCRLFEHGNYQNFLETVHLKYPLGPQEHPILIYDSNKSPVAGLKLVLPSEYELPIEKDFGISLLKMNYDRKNVGEIGRFCVLSHWRGTGPLLRAVYHSVARECIRNKVGSLLAEAILNNFAMYRKIGFEPLDGKETPRIDHEFGTEVILCRLDISKKIKEEFQLLQLKGGLSEQRSQQIVNYLREQNAF